MPELRVDRDGQGLRLDRFLLKALPRMPKGHVYKLLRTRKVRVNGKRAKGDHQLAAGDRVLLHMPAERFERDTRRPLRAARSLDFGVVFEDAHLLVVSKPPFLPVHPGAGHRDNSLIDQVHAYLEVQDRPGAFRPALAHRIDRDTSGLLLIGKQAEALRALSEMIKRGAVHKRYLALAGGRPRPPQGVWNLDVQRRDVPGAGRRPYAKRRRAAAGRTAYRVAATRQLRLSKRDRHPFSLLVLELLTGRTHQIRSHLEQMGHPLAGDRRYGDRDLNRVLRERFALRRQFLHAFRLELDHPVTGNPLRLVSPYPPDLEPLARTLKLGVPDN